MLKPLTGATALALLLAPAALAQADTSGGETVFRVFVGDHAAPRITAFDLSAPDRPWLFDTIGQAKLYAVAGGSAVAAVQSDANTVQFLSSGIRLEDHGDHQDIEITEPSALPHRLDGPRPFHLIDHGQRIVINLDQGGYAEIIDGAALARGALETSRFPQSVPHHGFVTPMGSLWLSSVAPPPPADGAEPAPRLGLQAFTAEGTPAGDLATCTGIHGEAFSGLYLAAGCAEGVLTARSGDEGIVYAMLPYPADLPAGNTTGTLLGATGMQVFLGNYGRDGLVVIDPADAPHFRLITLPFRRVDFVLDPMQPARGFVLTEDGTLHRIDLLAASLDGSASVTQPYSMDGHWNDPRPRLAMAGDEVLITDPREGRVRRIDAATLEDRGSIAVEGAPYSIAVVAASGHSH